MDLQNGIWDRLGGGVLCKPEGTTKFVDEPEISKSPKDWWVKISQKNRNNACNFKKRISGAADPFGVFKGTII